MPFRSVWRGHENPGDPLHEPLRRATFESEPDPSPGGLSGHSCHFQTQLSCTSRPGQRRLAQHPCHLLCVAHPPPLQDAHCAALGRQAPAGDASSCTPGGNARVAGQRAARRRIPGSCSKAPGVWGWLSPLGHPAGGLNLEEVVWSTKSALRQRRQGFNLATHVPTEESRPSDFLFFLNSLFRDSRRLKLHN